RLPLVEYPLARLPDDVGGASATQIDLSVFGLSLLGWVTSPRVVTSSPDGLRAAVLGRRSRPGPGPGRSAAFLSAARVGDRIAGWLRLSGIEWLFRALAGS